MGQYLRVAFVFGLTQLKRGFRDPMTLAVLFAIPLLLLLIFGAFLRDADNISLRVAVVNDSREPFAADFRETLTKVDVLELPEEAPDLNEAKQQMKDNELDGIVELPQGFGARNAAGLPAGTVKIYYDGTESQTGEIVASVMRSVVDETNKKVAAVSLPLDIAREPINVTQVKAIDNIFAMFTGLAVMMAGLFGVASVIPYDKKGGYLRRLRASPMRPGQFVLGTMMTFAVIGFAVVALMTALALLLFDLNMRGSWLVYGGFIATAIVAMLGFGLAIGGIAKNTTQSDIMGQTIFLGSLALGGVWFPRALMPEFIQSIVAFLPLTAIIDGIKAITVENASLAAVGPEIAVLAVWGIVAYTVGIKIFRWE